MEHINSFQSGMNQDLTKPLIKPTQYYLAENMSLVTEEGLTTAGLRNIKGNNLAVQIPDCSNVVEVLANATPITNGNVTVVGQVLAIVSDGTPEDFFDQLQTQIYATFGNTVRTVIDGDRILIFSGLDASNVLFANTVVVTSLIPELTISDVVPAQTGLHIMGWKKIRDSIYIFTTNELLATQPSGTSGQIWRLLYDKVSYNFNLFLIYNNIVDFSLQNPIAELSQAVGNFEN